MRRSLLLAIALLVSGLAEACTSAAPPALRPAPEEELEAFARGAPGSLVMARRTVSSEDGRILASCLAFAHEGGGVLLVLYVAELAPDGALSLRGRCALREAESASPFAYNHEGYDVVARPAGGTWGELRGGGELALEYRRRE